MTSQSESIDFIKRELIPEMVHNRCFCDAKSREFVEFESATVVPMNKLPTKFGGSCEIYRVNAVVRFSGIPEDFSLVVKLQRVTHDTEVAFEAFQNEEMFYSKMTLKYGTDYVPRSYLSDLGRYGRPTIVLEDLAANDYVQVSDKFDEDHTRLCVKLLGKLHGRGLKLKAEEFPVFREFYTKLLDVTFSAKFAKCYEERSPRVMDVLRLLPDGKIVEKIERKLGASPLNIAKELASDINDVSTICHGHFSRDNLLFKYENEKPIDVKAIDWQTMRYSSAAIDLGYLLFGDTTQEIQSQKVQELLTLYLDTVKSEYPETMSERLRQDVISKLLSPCLLLYFEGTVTDEKFLEILLLLNDLKAFD